ncbi:Ldh family oxidoreductase [Marinimicrococcus flavescens]
MMAERYEATGLTAFATRLFEKAGLDSEKAALTAELLVEADLMGHTTHGLQLAPGYLKKLAAGEMTAEGEPEIVADMAAVATWDGRYLPGLWLTSRAVDEAVRRAKSFGVGAVTIRRSHHIGCLAAFLTRATDQGCMLMLASSDPSVASVAPFGGRQPLFTPNPVACGIPTGGDPILIDISASVTTNGLSGRLAGEGRRLPFQWWLDADGNPTDDSAVIERDPPGSILPMGGLDHGHKGYGLALMIETLTQALSGFGRADAPTTWGASVFVQAFDPAAFGGLEAFERQAGWLADACRSNPPRPGMEKVRVPGDAALARKRRALAEGVELYPGIIGALAAEAGRLGVTPPQAIGG